MAMDYYTGRFPGSWAQTYLTERIGTDLTGDPHVQPGYAPAGWTTLVSHLRRQGATDLELTESGLATTTRNGRSSTASATDSSSPSPAAPKPGHRTARFRRPPPPPHAGEGRRPEVPQHPRHGLFHKGAQLYAVREDLLDQGATPVLVEGPMDALAVSIAGQGRFVGLAPLGTSLTEEQARQLAHTAHAHQRRPIVATDADLAGQIAAQRDYWLLAQHGLDPQTVALRPGSDPADLLALHGPAAVRDALQNPSSLGETLLTERLGNLSGLPAARQAALVLAASDPVLWDAGVERVSQSTGIPIRSGTPGPRRCSPPMGPRPAHRGGRADERPARAWPSSLMSRVDRLGRENMLATAKSS
jgi:hypothetical protein